MMIGRSVVPVRRVLVLCLLLAGCGGSSDGVVGTWELDNAAMTAAFEQQLAASGEAIPAMVRQAMAQAADEMDWTLSIHPGGRASMEIREGGAKLESFGSWTLDGETVAIDYLDNRDRSVVMTGIEDSCFNVPIPRSRLVWVFGLSSARDAGDCGEVTNRANRSR